MLSSQISGMALVFGLVQVIKYFDLANPKYALPIRVTYGVVQVVLLAALAYIRSCILKNNEKGSVTVVHPPKPFSDEEPKSESISIQEYDKRELYKVLQQTVIGAAILIAVHMWLKTLQPLIFQSIIPLKSLFTSNLFQIYILKRKAEGKLERPWKEASPFADLMQQNNKEEEEPTGIVELKESEDEEQVSAAEEPEKKSAEEPLLKNRKKTGRRDD